MGAPRRALGLVGAVADGPGHRRGVDRDAAGEPAHLRDWVPFAAAVAMFVLAFAGLGYSLWPYLVVDRIVYTDAAAAPGSLKIILAGAAVTLPVIVGYTVFAYRVFWGRSTELSYE